MDPLPTLDTRELISVTEAGKLGVSALVKVAERGEQRVLMRNNKPVAAVVGIESLERTEQLEERLLDVSLALTRLLTTNERRHSLDDVLDRFGFTRDDLEED
jgi:antitoxin (DNA-binding transcriptional repressor) of toxin-antitoxin stability system